MELTIRITMDNDAFGETSDSRHVEVKRILTAFLSNTECFPGYNKGRNIIGYGANLSDSDGNVVGNWNISV
jgi:hypothetical protein